MLCAVLNYEMEETWWATERRVATTITRDTRLFLNDYRHFDSHWRSIIVTFLVIVKHSCNRRSPASSINANRTYSSLSLFPSIVSSWRRHRFPERCRVIFEILLQPLIVDSRALCSSPRFEIESCTEFVIHRFIVRFVSYRFYDYDR